MRGLAKGSFSETSLWRVLSLPAARMRILLKIIERVSTKSLEPMSELTLELLKEQLETINSLDTVLISLVVKYSYKNDPLKEVIEFFLKAIAPGLSYQI